MQSEVVVATERCGCFVSWTTQKPKLMGGLICAPAAIPPLLLLLFFVFVLLSPTLFTPFSLNAVLSTGLTAPPT